MSGKSFRLFMTGLILIPYSCFAQDSTVVGKQPPWYEKIAINGFVSFGYSYNLNKPDVGKNFYRVFDFDDNSFKVDVIEMSLKKEAAYKGDAGFRFDLAAGSSIPRISQSSGLNIGDIGIRQMYLSYDAPVGTGLRLDFGKFITSMGYEVIEGNDGYNDNYSRSFLFGYAIPFTHTGIRAGYTFNENISAMFMIVNGWDNTVDSNKSKSVCAQVGIVPVDGLNLSANYMIGPEKTNNNSDNRSLFDVVGMYKLTEQLTIGINADYGTEQHSAGAGRNATWEGFAGYAKVRLSKDFSFAMRGEQFEDNDGVRTGISQKLRELTLTPEFRPAGNFIIRGDLRLDKSDQNVFQNESTWKDTQMTLALNILYSL